MAKQYYFAVCVEEDGTAWIDHEEEVNFGGGNVWNQKTEEWEYSYDENNIQAATRAADSLHEMLQRKNDN
jgi:hypothetical protein